MRATRYFLISILSLLSILCKNKNAGNEKNQKLSRLGGLKMMPYVADSLVGDSRQHLFLQNMGKCMGLPRMPRGLSTLNIRIWLWGWEKTYVVDLLDSGSHKRCYIAEVSSEMVNGQRQIAFHREWTDLFNASGLDSLFIKAEKYGITKLEGGKLAEQLRSEITQGVYVQFEVARPSGYRFFEYYTPDFYRDVDPGSRKVYNFLKYLNKQSGLTVYDGVDDDNEDFKAGD
jgi:hypothetical protein